MLLEVRGGHFGYGEREILSDINFTLHSGEILAVLGANGVGKTTLLKCALGFLQWSKGGTFIDERDMREFKPVDIRRRIAYVPQAKNMNLALSAEDMILLGRAARLSVFSQPSKEDRRIVDETMELVGISYLHGKKCTQMSGGELQMVLIARALCTKPEIIILDEPESNLDFKNQLIVLELLKTLTHSTGVGVLVNTHYPEHAIKIADSGLLLIHHSKNLYGAIRDIISEENMKKAFQVKVHINEMEYGDKIYVGVTPIEVQSDGSGI
ncbi:MAG: ABC transporter ATP-binding protein [Clostridiales Family XIII bacterium]|jgi:iron complex transport system ATP-binding protein|nr:ABC transporter ATP-binding protein [Clostridiales Family XIII bacterium]